MATFQQVYDDIIQIRDERRPAANTATRVGTTMLDLLSLLNGGDAASLDGHGASYFAPASDLTALQTTVGGHTTAIASLVADVRAVQGLFDSQGAALQAVKLKTARSLWGQPFDGSDDVTGTLQSVDDIEMTGALKMAFGNSWFESKLDTNGDLQFSGNVYALGAVSALGVSAAGIDTGGGGGGGATSLSELSDTAIALPMSAGQALVFDDGKWRNRLLAWNDLSGKPTTFSPSTHTHVKADITDFAHTHVKADITDFAHTHVKADITDFPTTWAWSAITGKPTTWAWSAITGKPTTLSGYGITDAATASQMTAATGRISGLEGYFDNGVANSAKRLSGTETYTAWGQTYWQNGVPKGNINGDIDVNNHSKIIFWQDSYIHADNNDWLHLHGNEGILFDGPISLDGFVIENDSDRLKFNGDIYATGAVSALGISDEGVSPSGAVYLSGLLDVTVGGVQNGQVLTYNSTQRKWVAQTPATTDLTSYATQQWVTQQGYLTQHQSLAAYATQQWVYDRGFAYNADLQDLYSYNESAYVKALGTSGDYLTWTRNGATNNLTVPFATTALGFKRLNKEAAGTWDANTMTVNNVQYALLTNYRATAEWANMPSGMSWGGVLQITAGSGVGLLSGQLAWDANHNVTTGVTRKLYWRSRNSTGWGTNDWHTIAFEDWVTKGFLPLSAGSGKPLTGSLYFNSTGIGVYFKDKAGSNYAAIVDNGDNLWIGAYSTASYHHRGNTLISAGHDGTHGNTTIFVSVPNDANNGGNNYGVWHSGNFHPGDYLPLTGGTLTGNLYISRTNGNSGIVSVGNANGSIELLTYNNRGVYDRTADHWLIGTDGTYTFLLGGNVGIGKTTPSAKLDVVGNIAAKHTSGEVLTLDSSASYTCTQFKVGSTAKWSVGADSSKFYFYSNNGNAIRMSILEGGNVGIGTLEPAEKLHVIGNIMASGAVSALGVSAAGSGGGALSLLSDVAISGTPVDGQVLKFDGTQGKWVAASGGGSFTGDADTLDGKHASDFVAKAGFFYNSKQSGAIVPNGITLPLAWQSGGVYSLDLSDYALTTSLGNYLPLGAGSSKRLSGSLYFDAVMKGVYMKDPAGNDYSAIIQNGSNLWIGAYSTTSYHHRGETYISAGHNGTKGNPTIYVCVPSAANNNGTNYAVWHSGNFTPGNYLPLTGGTLTGNLVMGNVSRTTNDDSAKIAFYTNDNYPNISPYIQAINEANYGRKRLSVFQKNVEDWNTPQVEVFTIKPNGNVGVGSASPAYKLDVNGDMRAAGHIYGGNCLFLPVAGSVFIDQKNMLTYNSAQMLSLGYGMRNDTGTKTDIYGKEVEIKEKVLRIGSCVIDWDSTNNMLRFSGGNGIYAMGAVSALGIAGDLNGQVTRPMTFLQPVTMQSTLTVTGQLTLNNTSTGSSSFALLSNGKAKINSTLQVTGALSAGSATITGALSAGGNTTVGGHLSVSGTLSTDDSVVAYADVFVGDSLYFGADYNAPRLYVSNGHLYFNGALIK